MMFVRRKRTAYTLAVLLIGIGAFGILLSPSAGVAGGKELRSFALRDVRESDWGTSIIISEFELPYIRNQRGLAFMHGLIGASMVTLFSGVHLFARLRSRPI
jgi:hypothetical protein